MTPAEIVARLERHTSRDESGCWIWTGAVQSRGYSSVGIDGKVYSAHRVSYEVHKGPIPDGMTIDHLCRVKRCINPDHLEVVTRAENNLRRLASMTHCKNNHPLAGDNLLNSTRGKRICRECSRSYQRQRYERQKGSSVRRYSRRDGLSAGEFTHGHSGYCNHACRCDVCRSGAAEYYQRAKARKSTPIT